jgi:hypothetical protein
MKAIFEQTKGVAQGVAVGVAVGVAHDVFTAQKRCNTPVFGNVSTWKHHNRNKHPSG